MESIHQPTLYPSRVWTFAIWVSSFLMLVFSWGFAPIYLGFEIGFLTILFHWLSFYFPLFPFYFLFIFLSHSIIKRNQNKTQIKLELSFLGLVFSIITGWINYEFFQLSYFSGIAFFISLGIGIWIYKIDHHKIIETFKDDILDENL